MNKLCAVVIDIILCFNGVENATAFFTRPKCTWVPVRNITAVNRINATVTKLRKKRGGSGSWRTLKRGCTRFAFACLLRQQKNISSLFKIVKGIFYTCRKNRTKDHDTLWPYSLKNRPLQCNKSLECPTALKVGVINKDRTLAARRRENAHGLRQAGRVKDCRQKAWRKRLDNQPVCSGAPRRTRSSTALWEINVFMGALHVLAQRTR